jgi:hypothetical protein
MAAPPKHIRCAFGGTIGGSSVYRPAEPWEFGWGQVRTPVLCSRILCATCSTFVRSVPNHALPPREGASVVRPIDFAGRPIDLVKALRLVVQDGARTLACACRVVTVTGPHALERPIPGATLPLHWRCAGHPPMPTKGAVLDGETLPDDPAGWFQLLEHALRGEWPTRLAGRAVHDARHPAFRLAHVLVHLTDVVLQRALARRIASWGLLHDEPRVRLGALDLYRLLPRFGGFEQLADAMTRHYDRFDGIVVPDLPELELGRILREAVDAQVRAGPIEPISQAIRMDSLAGRGCAAFVRVIVRDDPKFATQYARVLAAPHPMRRVVLREAMVMHGDAMLAALDKALAAVP